MTADDIILSAAFNSRGDHLPLTTDLPHKRLFLCLPGIHRPENMNGSTTPGLNVMHRVFALDEDAKRIEFSRSA